MRAWIVFLAACSFPTKHAGNNPSDAPMNGADGSGQIDSTRTIDAPIDAPKAIVKRVFVSSAVVPPNFNGPGGADSMCANFANSAGLGGQWISWISTPNFPAAARIVPAMVPYTLTDKQTLVAQNFTDLSDGNLAHPIDHDEFNQPGQLTSNCQIASCVWTGTNPNGGFLSPDCLDWTSNTPFDGATIGDFTRPTPQWSAFGQSPCSNLAHIYCIEQ